MKKILLPLALIAACTSTTSIAEEGKLGLGFSGAFYGELLPRLSVRSWASETFAIEGNFGHVKVDSGDSSFTVNLYSVKFLSALRVNAHSKFYVGLAIGKGEIKSTDTDTSYSYYDDESTTTTSTSKADIELINFLFGSEYSSQESPELAWNWEVGYRMTELESDLDISGLTAEAGVHYYF